MPSWLKTFNPAASTSKTPAQKPAPKAGSSSKAKPAKKEDRKEDLPATPRPASPPPAYATRAPGAMPAGSSRAIARRGDHNDNGHGYADQDDFEDDFEEDFDDQKGKAIVKRGKQGDYDDEENQYGASHHRHKNDSENNRDDRKGKEVMRRAKSRRGPSESESESDSDQGYKSKKKGKELVKHGKDSKKKDRKSKKKQESSSDSDSDEQIVEKRQRFEAISVGELHQNYVADLRKCFEVRVEKIERWCDDGLIRLDTKDGSFNLDKLLNSKKVEEDEKKRWAMFEKRYRRYIANIPGGEMRAIPRFDKYLPKGPSRSRSGPSVVYSERNPSVVYSGRNPSAVPLVRSPQVAPPMESPRGARQLLAEPEPPMNVFTDSPYHSACCVDCVWFNRYCGIRRHLYNQWVKDGRRVNELGIAIMYTVTSGELFIPLSAPVSVVGI